MDLIRQQWNLIQERLAGLTASQKMLVGALVVITIMTMLYWGRFASSREMVALNSVPMSAEEIATATASLRARGISFTTSGSTIMVPAESQIAAMSDLSFNQALPSSPNFFEAMFDKVSTFGARGDYLARLNNARERTLGKIISGWPDVRLATVVIHDTQERGIGRNEPRASVDISTKSGAGTKKLAQTAARFVVNSFSGLELSRITVTIDGQGVNTSSDGLAGDAGEMFDRVRQFETAMAEKIRGNFVAFIPSIIVSVTADVDNQSKKEVKETYDPKSKIVTPVDVTSETMTTTEALPGGDPGMMANSAMDANTAPMQAPGTTTERTTERMEVSIGKSQMEIITPPGKPTCLGAAIRVPRSYFTKIWRANMRKTDGEPSDAEYGAIMQAETERIRGEVKRLTAIEDESKISVAEFPDFDTVAAAMAPASGDTGVRFMAATYAKEGAIGVLALASLFMVSRIVKKSVPAPSIAIAGIGSVPLNANMVGGTSRSRNSAQLVPEEDIAGDVAEGGQVLMGQELDPATLETAQMVDQVSKYVKDNPDTAASLVRRMMARE